jgi:hypothetical protein
LNANEGVLLAKTYAVGQLAVIAAFPVSQTAKSSQRANVFRSCLEKQTFTNAIV